MREDKVQLPAEVVDDVRTRLRRAAGQVQAVERMLSEGRECRDVITQLSAATRALEQAGFKLIAAGLAYCLEDPDQAEADGYPLETIERMFMKLAQPASYWPTPTGRPLRRHSGKPSSRRRARYPRLRSSATASSAYTQ